VGDLTIPAVPRDSDADGLLDQDEIVYGTDPQLIDSDGDGYTDGAEVHFGSSPTDKNCTIFGCG
jgi:hypothetical protein